MTSCSPDHGSSEQYRYNYQTGTIEQISNHQFYFSTLSMSSDIDMIGVLNELYPAVPGAFFGNVESYFPSYLTTDLPTLAADSPNTAFSIALLTTAKTTAHNRL